MRPNRTREFYYLTYDTDALQYDYIGPVTSRGDWDEKLLIAEAHGRKVGSAVYPTSEEVERAAKWYESNGYHRARIIDGTALIEKADEYSGALPKYAQRADRARIVRFRCSNCGAVYAEMNKPYPGADALKQSELGVYTAHCLRCKAPRSDPYNWWR